MSIFVRIFEFQMGIGIEKSDKFGFVGMNDGASSPEYNELDWDDECLANVAKIWHWSRSSERLTACYGWEEFAIGDQQIE